MIILAVILILSALVIWKRGSEINFALGLPLGILVAMWVFLSMMSSTGVTYQVQNRPLVALADGTQGLRGSFFLGSGSIGGGDVGYNFYMADADGAYQLSSVPAHSAKVVERPGPASIDIIQTCNYRGGGLWAFPIRTLDCEGMQEPVNYKFYVPKGSVISNYNLDAKP